MSEAPADSGSPGPPAGDGEQADAAGVVEPAVRAVDAADQLARGLEADREEAGEVDRERAACDRAR
jgi:hypothetical protein